MFLVFRHGLRPGCPGQGSGAIVPTRGRLDCPCWRRRGDRLRIGVPFLFSMHAELVRYWLAGLGVALPDDVQIVTVPPARMADALVQGEIDAFCVGEPRAQGGLRRNPIWPGGARWLMAPQNRMMAPEIIARSLTGRLVISPDGAERTVPGFIEFHAGAASFPWRSQAAWIGVRLARRDGLDPLVAMTAAQAVFRSDLHRHHLHATGADLPGASEKLEGSLDRPCAVASERGKLILPVDRFYDAKIFDPADPLR